MIYNIAVFGSCASRDNFYSGINPDYKKYFNCSISSQRGSIISLMQEPVPFKNQDIQILPENRVNKAGTQFINQDLTKNFLAEVKKFKPDYILIDNYFEVIFGIIKYENCFITNNYWDLPKTRFYTEIKSYTKINMYNDPNTYLKLYKENMNLFLDYIQKESPNSQIILNPVRLGYKILKNDNKIEVNKNLDDILDSIFKENFIKEFDNDNNDWKIKNIGELPLIITDYVANGSFASLKENVTILDYEEYAYFIRNTDLKSKSFQKFVNKHSYDFLKKSSLFGNEVIISNVGDVGSVFLCPFLDKPMTLGNNMILVKSRDDAINLNFYLFLLFRSNYGQYLISTITAGSVQSKFNKTEFKSLELTMPNDELIIKFNNLVSPIFDYKNKISDEIVRLTKLRDTLLPKLMSGEIDVSKINCDLKIIIRKIYIKSSKLFLWRYLSENKNYIKNTKSNETLLKSRTIYKINKFLAKFNARYRYYRQ